MRRSLLASLALAAPGMSAPASVLAHGASAPPPEFPAVLLAWRFDPTVVIGLAVAAAAYLWAVRRVNRAHPANRQPRYRSWLFFGGLAAGGLALLSPIEAYEGALFSVHMVQHILLQFVAAPLLLAAAPITLTLRVAAPSVRRRLLAILQSRAIHLMSFPVIAWILFAGVNWGWHFSVFYDQA
ncbi:MAG: cytochrome c oxidase assembly protein, partial [Chloroflexi bacterium]|nr:cytochrome c oxidase assembly protein [Chloroflexota bacterium]